MGDEIFIDESIKSKKKRCPHQENTIKKIIKKNHHQENTS